MQVIKYLDNKFPDLLKNIESKIDEGADGEVYNLKSGNVAKFSIFFAWHGESMATVLNQKLKAFERVKELPDTFVKVSNFQRLMEGKRVTYSGEQDFLIYYYEMEKLQKISEDEKRVMHSILSHEDSNIEKDIGMERVLPILNGLSFGLDFDETKVINFVKKLQKLETDGIRYLDYHPRNIMKDLGGNFKLIDIDRMSIF